MCRVSRLTRLFVLLVSEMLTGWWRVSDIEQLRALVNALHSRGIREKGLQRQVQKYMEIIPQVCTKHRDGEYLSRWQEEQSFISVRVSYQWIQSFQCF